MNEFLRIRVRSFGNNNTHGQPPLSRDGGAGGLDGDGGADGLDGDEDEVAVL